MGAEWCVREPWRLIQTNLRETDLAGIDPERFAQALEDFSATVVMVSAAGIIANYDSELEFHTRNPLAPKGRLRELVQACHKRGIRVLARTDFSKIRKNVFDVHPEWAYRTAGGEVMEYNGNIQTCLNGGYQQEYVFQILEELFTRFPFDGIYCNMGGFQTVDYSYKEYGRCHCESCRRLFRERYHRALPNEGDEEGIRLHRVFQDDCVKQYRSRMESFLHGLNPELAVDLCDFQRSEAGTELGNSERTWLYGASSNSRSAGPSGNMRASNADVDFLGYPYRHVSVAPETHKIRLLQNLMNLGGLDYYMMGDFESHRDRTAYPAVKEIFRLAKTHEREFAGLRTAAKLLLVRKALWGTDPEERGWIRLLSELHVPFAECLPETFPDAAELRRFKMVILPDFEFVSDELAEELDRFVTGGGILLASGRSGFGNAAYQRRANNALRCLGIKRLRYVREDAVSTMLQKGDADGIFESVASPYIATGALYVLADMDEHVQSYFKMIPPHMFGPPEKCYFTYVSQVGGVTRHSFGKGSGIYIPWLPGKLFYQEGHLNTKNFMQDVVLRLCGQDSIAPALTPMVETSLSEGEGRMLCCLLNLSGRFLNSDYAPLALENAELRLPVKRPVKTVRSLLTRAALWHSKKGGELLVRIPKLNLFEGVVAEYA